MSCGINQATPMRQREKILEFTSTTRNIIEAIFFIASKPPRQGILARTWMAHRASYEVFFATNGEEHRDKEIFIEAIRNMSLAITGSMGYASTKLSHQCQLCDSRYPTTPPQHGATWASCATIAYSVRHALSPIHHGLSPVRRRCRHVLVTRRRRSVGLE